MEKINEKLLDELNALEENIDCLECYMKGDAEWDELDSETKELMDRQRLAMIAYQSALSDRVRKFAEPYICFPDSVRWRMRKEAETSEEE